MIDHNAYSDEYISDILKSVKSVALVGASNNPARPSWQVMKFLLDTGYDVIPVNPGHAGEKIQQREVYATLADIPQAIDMVDIFRNSEAAGKVVDEALALLARPKVIWMQLAIRNDEAAAKAEALGVKVVMDRCPKIELAQPF